MKLSKEEQAALKAALAAMGRIGGLARAKRMTKRERSEGASLAANARWAAVKAAKAAAEKEKAGGAKKGKGKKKKLEEDANA
jgi:hypothetical protein